jgi:hypothetical protein
MSSEAEKALERIQAEIYQEFSVECIRRHIPYEFKIVKNGRTTTVKYNPAGRIEERITGPISETLRNNLKVEKYLRTLIKLQNEQTINAELANSHSHPNKKGE